MYEDALRRWPRDDHPLRPSGRVLAPAERLTVKQAIRAQTIDAAWLLFADDVVGSLEVGSTPTWWCCRPIRAPCRRRRSPISRCKGRSWRVGRFTRKGTDRSRCRGTLLIMSDLAEPRFLDERLAHWAETKPDDEAIDLSRPNLDVGAVERPRPPACRRADGLRRQAR